LKITAINKPHYKFNLISSINKIPVMKKRLYNKRVKQFNIGLIEVVNMISNSLRAGTSLAQSMDVVVSNSVPPVSDEFSIVVNELRLGVSLEQALNNMSSRLKSKDLDLFVTTVNIARQTGGSLPEILSTIAQTMVERNKVQGKIDALTAQGKMSGYIVSAMPFILMALLALMSPELVEPMFSTGLGLLMLSVTVFLVAIGALLINKIVSIDI
jgi:tight adherence protein B